MYVEEDFLPLSSISQYFYCHRRVALTLVEQQWADNLYTTEGTVLHHTVDAGLAEARVDVRVYRGVHVRSFRLGAVGQLDVLEARRVESAVPGRTLTPPGESQHWMLYPVEYKHGPIRVREHAYMAQLCAQAMCLEEMLDITIPTGFLYFGQSRRRLDVPLSQDLRDQVVRGFEAVHRLREEGQTPPPEPGPKCTACSMQDVCVPGLSHDRVHRYLTELTGAASSEK